MGCRVEVYGFSKVCKKSTPYSEDDSLLYVLQDNAWQISPNQYTFSKSSYENIYSQLVREKNRNGSSVSNGSLPQSNLYRFPSFFPFRLLIHIFSPKKQSRICSYVPNSWYPLTHSPQQQYYLPSQTSPPFSAWHYHTPLAFASFLCQYNQASLFSTSKPASLQLATNLHMAYISSGICHRFLWSLGKQKQYKLCGFFSFPFSFFFL